jgi:hypothetical protein
MMWLAGPAPATLHSLYSGLLLSLQPHELYDVKQRGQHIAKPDCANTQPMEKDVDTSVQAAIRCKQFDKQQDTGKHKQPVEPVPFEF